MSKVYVVQSVEGHYFSKQEEWVSGKDDSTVYISKHKDEALNQLLDITIKDINVRAKVVEIELNGQDLPELEIIVHHDLIEDSEETEDQEIANTKEALSA